MNFASHEIAAFNHLLLSWFYRTTRRDLQPPNITNCYLHEIITSQPVYICQALEI